MQTIGAVLRKPLHRVLREGRGQEPEGGAKREVLFARSEQGRSQGNFDGTQVVSPKPQKLA